MQISELCMDVFLVMADSSRISQLEEKIGAGLIEEVIEVAKGELRLADSMFESKM